MGATPDRLEVGRIIKPHGLRGEVVVLALSDVEQRFEPGSVLRSESTDLTVSSSRTHSGRLLVKLEGVDDRTAAEALRGAILTAEPLGLAPEGTYWVHELIGARVFDLSGDERGTVTGVIDNPAHELLELDDGRLVPITFVVEKLDDRIVVDAPNGLFDI